MKKPSLRSRWLRPLIEELERRLLMSADVESVLIDPNLAHHERVEEPAAQLEMLEDGSQAGEVAAVTSRELVFVDAGVEGYEQLLEDLRAGGAEGRELEVVLLDSERDGVAQITETQARFQDPEGILIFEQAVLGLPGQPWQRDVGQECRLHQVAKDDHSFRVGRFGRCIEDALELLGPRHQLELGQLEGVGLGPTRTGQEQHRNPDG